MPFCAGCALANGVCVYLGQKKWGECKFTGRIHLMDIKYFLGWRLSWGSKWDGGTQKTRGDFRQGKKKIK